MQDLPPVTISAVAFDLDGTTLNSEDLYLEVCTELMARRGHEYDWDTRSKMMGLPAPQAYEVLINSKSLTESADDLQLECDEIFEGILEQKLRPMPGVNALLDRLDQWNIPRCIATSSRLSFANRALRIVNLYNRFNFVITAEHVAHGKPEPDIYLLAAQKLGAPISQLLVLEDSSIGVRAGAAAKAITIAVPNEHTKGSVFNGAVGEVASLEDERFLSWIERSFRRPTN
jgi:HAD superfamily hydrolase (TIGR01509 family)